MDQNTELNAMSDNIWTIQNKIASLSLEIAKKKAELQQTDLRKQIEASERLLREYQNTEWTIKTNIVNSMLSNGLKSVEFVNQKFTIKKNPWSLKINDEEMIPQEFKKEKVEIVIDKKAIKDKISAGEDVAGCEITYSHSLVITPKW